MRLHEERVVAEKVELDKKILALTTFIIDSYVYKGLDETDRELLIIQECYMKEYSNVLNRRISRFK